MVAKDRGGGDDDGGKHEDEDGSDDQTTLQTADRNEDIADDEIPEGEAIDSAASEAVSNGPDVDIDNDLFIAEDPDSADPENAYVDLNDVAPWETFSTEDDEAVMVPATHERFDDVDVFDRADNVWIPSARDPTDIDADSGRVFRPVEDDGDQIVSLEADLGGEEGPIQEPNVVNKIELPNPSSAESIEEYQDMLIQRVAAAGIEIGDPDGEPVERIQQYNRLHRSNPEPQYRDIGIDEGGFPHASIDDIRNRSFYGQGVREVDKGIIPGDGRDAYVATYAKRKFRDVDPQNLYEREQTTYAFLDAAGVRVPRHQFSEGGLDDIIGESMSREVSGPEIDKLKFKNNDVSELYNAVEEQQAIDHASFQTLAGNWDFRSGNAIITDGEGADAGPQPTSDDQEMGNIVCFDLDRGAASIKEYGVGQTVNESPVQDCHIDVSRKEIWQNTRAIAQDIFRSGDFERLTNAAAEHGDEEWAKNIAQNIAHAAIDPDDVFSPGLNID